MSEAERKRQCLDPQAKKAQAGLEMFGNGRKRVILWLAKRIYFAIRAGADRDL